MGVTPGQAGGVPLGASAQEEGSERMRKSGLPPPHPRPEVQPRGSCPTLRGSRRVSAPPPPHSPQSRLVVQSQGEKMLLVPPLPVRFPPPPVCSPSLLLPSPMPPSVPVTLKVKGISHLLLSTSPSGGRGCPSSGVDGPVPSPFSGLWPQPP